MTRQGAKLLQGLGTRLKEREAPNIYLPYGL